MVMIRLKGGINIALAPGNFNLRNIFVLAFFLYFYIHLFSLSENDCFKNFSIKNDKKTVLFAKYAILLLEKILKMYYIIVERDNTTFQLTSSKF